VDALDLIYATQDEYDGKRRSVNGANSRRLYLCSTVDDYDAAKTLVDGDGDVSAWNQPPRVSTGGRRVIILSRADSESVAQSKEILSRCSPGAAAVYLVIFPGLGLEHRRLDAWAAVEGNDFRELIEAEITRQDAETGRTKSKGSHKRASKRRRVTDENSDGDDGDDSNDSVVASKGRRDGKPTTQEPTHSEILLEIASEASFFHSPDTTPYAAVPVGGHTEVYEVGSPSLKRWLTHGFYCRQGKPPSAQSLADTISVLAARAIFKGPQCPVFVRLANRKSRRRGLRTYLDLGDAAHRAVVISSTGWKVVRNPVVKFRRPAGMKELPVPVRGWKIDRLKEFVNVADSEFILLVAWLAAALRPVGPYPVLVLAGEQGSSKSTLAKMIRRLVDNHVSPLRCEPSDIRQLMLSATNSWVVALDNLSHLPPWMSDALCRLSTGGGIAVRRLYTDNEEVFLDAVRPLILTGITDYVGRNDLIDRSLFLHLPTMPEGRRKTESELWREFDDAVPYLLGALLDALAGGLALLPSIQISKDARMMDFALLGEAVSQAIGGPPGEFTASFAANRQTANETAIDNSIVANAVVQLISAEPGEIWSGPVTKLKTALENAVNDEKLTRSRYWPATSSALGAALKRDTPVLRRAGIVVTNMRSSSRRLVRIERVQPEGPLEADNEQKSRSSSSSLSRPLDLKAQSSDSDDQADVTPARSLSPRNSRVNYHPARGLRRFDDSDDGDDGDLCPGSTLDRENFRI
jgi:hypothetical protein